MKKIAVLFCGLLICAGTCYAQKGDAAIGLRLSPDGIGFTGKYFVDRNIAFEGQLNAGGVMGLQGESFNAVGLLEYHIPLPDPSWHLYFGGGAHVGVWNEYDADYYVNERRRLDRDKDFILGIDGVGGVEYMFKRAPVALSADIKPAINLLSDVDFFSHNMLGISAKYYFGR